MPDNDIAVNLDMLGFKAKDRVTGFAGTITSISFDLSGCIQAAVSPPTVDGKLADAHWFDTKRLDLLSNAPVMKTPEFVKVPGGSILPAPSRRGT